MAVSRPWFQDGSWTRPSVEHRTFHKVFTWQIASPRVRDPTESERTIRMEAAGSDTHNLLRDILSLLQNANSHAAESSCAMKEETTWESEYQEVRIIAGHFRSWLIQTIIVYIIPHSYAYYLLSILVLCFY